MKCFACLASVLLGAAASAVFAEPITQSFDEPAALEPWTVSGDVAIDTARNRGDGAGGALRIAPGGKAIWKLREQDGVGVVEMWVYDDLAQPQDPLARGVGPRWGLIRSDGRVLVMGAIFAPYLSGHTHYTASDSDQKTWFNVQYSAIKRSEGWHKWTFRLDPAEGLTIRMDDKHKARFDVGKAELRQFSGIALFGGQTGQPQTIWVDDVAVTLGETGISVPGPEPKNPDDAAPVASVVPASDPPASREMKLNPAVAGRHPRLLFGPDDVERLRSMTQGEAGPFYDQLLKYLPSCTPADNTKFLTDATEAQREAFWKLPTVALHYVITGDRQSLERATRFLERFAELEHWETGDETDSGMGAANIMIGVSLAYDWLYNDLDPAFRDAFRKKLFEQARRMYHRGHLKKAGRIHYWQNDPQNNHRWHRDGGLALAVMAVADDNDPADDWLIEQTLAELKFVHQWLPADGSCHESSSYQAFGAPYLTLAFQAADRCMGTTLLEHDYFRNAPAFRLYNVTPGLADAFHYGDSSGFGHYNNYTFEATGRYGQADVQDGLLKLFAAQPSAFAYGWMSLVWFNPEVKGGWVENLPPARLFPDLGVAIMRDGWEADDVAMMFKSSPYGGAILNAYRNEGNYRYINVAHDDPDANSFLLFAGGKFVADNDRYSTKKVSSAQNTIVVNGKGQLGEGAHWTQPLKPPYQDMTKLARITAWKTTENVTLAEGEAGGAYEDLTRYRRAALWVPGSYVLLLDDIRGQRENEITWLVQSPQVQIPSSGRYTLGADSAVREMVVASPVAFVADVADSPADHRGKPRNLHQLRLTARAQQWQLATVIDAWNHGGLEVAMTPAEQGAFTITVKGNGLTDNWTWQPPADAEGNAVIRMQRQGGFAFEAGADAVRPAPVSRAQ